MEELSKTIILRRAAVDGDNGTSALTARLTPEVLSFTADKNGTLDATTKTAIVTLYYGSNTATITKLTAGSTVGCKASTSGTTGCVIEPTLSDLTYTDSEGNEHTISGKKVPATAGSATFTAVASYTDENGKAQTATVAFAVAFTCDVCTQYGELIINDEQFTSRLTTVEGTADKLTTSVSEINQKSDEIALMVKQSTSRNNLIANSWLNMVSNSYGETCVRSVQLTKGTTYILSIEGRVIDAALLRTYIYNTGWSEQSHVDITSTSLTTATLAFTPKATGTYYISFYNGTADEVTTNSDGTSNYPTGYIHVRRVKLEVAQKVGDNYVATTWTESEQDVGSGTNILPPQQQYATEEVTGADGLTHEVAVADSSAITDSYCDVVYSQISDSVVLCTGDVYTLSFLAKAENDGETIYSYLYGTTSAGTQTVCQGSTNTNTAATPSKDGDGFWVTALATEWQRITITFTTKTTLPASYAIIVARLMKNASGGKCYFYDFKLECGGRWTGAGVTEDALYATGIDIKNRQINITSDQLNVYNNSGELTMSVDEDGNLVPTSLQTMPASDGSYTSIKGGLINIVGKNAGNAAGNRIAFGVSEETDLITMYYYGSTGSLIWYLNNAGLKYVAVERGAYFVTETSLIPRPSIMSGVTGGSTLATAKKLTTAQYTAIQKVGEVNTYVYHAPYIIDDETKEETIVQDETYGLTQAQAEEYNTCLFKTLPTEGAGITVFRADVAGADNETEYYLVCIYAVGSITKYACYPVIDGVNRYTTAGITDENTEYAPTYFYYNSDHPTA